jgi:hypothetical protein
VLGDRSDLVVGQAGHRHDLLGRDHRNSPQAVSG